jgi:hypothetical protein
VEVCFQPRHQAGLEIVVVTIHKTRPSGKITEPKSMFCIGIK